MSLPHHWLQSSDWPKSTPFSRALVLARREKGLSQKELAAMLEIDYVLLSRIENARRTAEPELLEKIFVLFINPVWVVGQKVARFRDGQIVQTGRVINSIGGETPSNPWISIQVESPLQPAKEINYLWTLIVAGWQRSHL